MGASANPPRTRGPVGGRLAVPFCGVPIGSGRPGVSTFVEVLPGDQPTVTTPDAQHLPVTTPVASAPAPSFTAFRTSSESGGELLPVAAAAGGKGSPPQMRRGRSGSGGGGIQAAAHFNPRAREHDCNWTGYLNNLNIRKSFSVTSVAKEISHRAHRGAPCTLRETCPGHRGHGENLRETTRSPRKLAEELRWSVQETDLAVWEYTLQHGTDV